MPLSDKQKAWDRLREWNKQLHARIEKLQKALLIFASNRHWKTHNEWSRDCVEFCCTKIPQPWLIARQALAGEDK